MLLDVFSAVIGVNYQMHLSLGEYKDHVMISLSEPEGRCVKVVVIISPTNFWAEDETERHRILRSTSTHSYVYNLKFNLSTTFQDSIKSLNNSLFRAINPTDKLPGICESARRKLLDVLVV